MLTQKYKKYGKFFVLEIYLLKIYCINMDENYKEKKRKLNYIFQIIIIIKYYYFLKNNNNNKKDRKI